ncbi:UDP-2,4-diacetamido-2,4,6-trideoxy-beta-L-altropyranose hydrolase [Pseudoalteromonas sp. SA25]|uniref:UDP-2,4-diacetamido-2,4, 6-trideoxy-beta-L-altropyranose hydrolase n=1 Tax=Pseudoalteromonas sp. SA25 TaxID=2686347 RepID=UPI0013FE2B20|nr:UDP-2,4-diacetamido-2,4,6-trideoxy-beta-L-altropyranose hydrolase [Pseudoalteromonas sp. SA25]
MSFSLNLFIRADASSIIGLGHLYRTLVFAKYALQYGTKVHYFCRDHDGYDYSWLLKHGVALTVRQSRKELVFDSVENSTDDKDWLGVSSIDDSDEFNMLLSQSVKDKTIVLVDHYGVDICWENSVREYCDQLITISDKASRKYGADIVVDPTFNRVPEEYLNYVNGNTQVLTGGNMCFIDNRFLELKSGALSRRKRKAKVSNILIMFGGADPLNLTDKLLEQLISSGMRHNLNIVIGSANKHKAQIKKKYSYLSFIKIHYNTTEMPKLTAEADLAIGAAGSACWERAVLGLPSIIVPFESNQLDIAHSLNKVHAAEIVTLEHFSSLSERVALLCKSYKNRKILTENSSTICDGQGALRLYTRLVNKYV